MPSGNNAAIINRAAAEELLSLVRLYGPNGYINTVNGGSGTGGPPADVIAALERLETATVDPTVLADGQTVTSIETQTIADLSDLAGFTRDQLVAAQGPPGRAISMRAASERGRYPAIVAKLEVDAGLFTPSSPNPPVTVVNPPPPPASEVEQHLVVDVTTGVSDWENGQACNGPAATLQNEFLDVTTDNIDITVTKPNNYVRTGSGDDAIDLSLFPVSQGRSGGTDIVDVGSGSNFLISGVFCSNTDIFY